MTAVTRVLLGLAVLAGMFTTGCASTPPGSSDQGPMPRISGAFGTKPVVDIPAGKPSDNPVFRVLSEGEGDPVSEGDAVVAHVGVTVWNGEQDYLNTYDTAQPTSISLDGKHVARSWHAALVGRPAGSRVLLVSPAPQGFGPDGMPPAQVEPTDTLVVVFDILGGYPPDISADGRSGTEPSITLPKGAEPPNRTRVTELRTGDGKAVREGDTVVLQYTVFAANADAVVDSSYRRQAPNGFALESGHVPPGWVRALDGTRVGSRVLVEVPKSATRGVRPTPGGLATPTGTDLVYVLDVVDVIRTP